MEVHPYPPEWDKWPPFAMNHEQEIDGRDPAGIEHICIEDLQIHDGPVEECCETRWREERDALDSKPWW